MHTEEQGLMTAAHSEPNTRKTKGQVKGIYIPYKM